ncbi:MAG: hypothetical protein LBR91_01760 [Puniceicoccales bacterium]|nr:hypothetical protein [Puniceicoccales bacterium]
MPTGIADVPVPPQSRVESTSAGTGIFARIKTALSNFSFATAFASLFRSEKPANERSVSASSSAPPLSTSPLSTNEKPAPMPDIQIAATLRSDIKKHIDTGNTISDAIGKAIDETSGLNPEQKESVKKAVSNSLFGMKVGSSVSTMADDINSKMPKIFSRHAKGTNVAIPQVKVESQKSGPEIIKVDVPKTPPNAESPSSAPKSDNNNKVSNKQTSAPKSDDNNKISNKQTPAPKSDSNNEISNKQTPAPKSDSNNEVSNEQTPAPKSDNNNEVSNEQTPASQSEGEKTEENKETKGSGINPFADAKAKKSIRSFTTTGALRFSVDYLKVLKRGNHISKSVSYQKKKLDINKLIKELEKSIDDIKNEKIENKSVDARELNNTLQLLTGDIKQNNLCLPIINIDDKIIPEQKRTENEPLSTDKCIQRIESLSAKEITLSELREKETKIIDTLKNVREYVLENEPTPEKIENIRRSVNELGRKEIIHEPNEQEACSINERGAASDSANPCLAISLELESTLIALDAVKAGQSGLITTGKLGQGQCGSVFKATTESKNKIAIKPCDAHRRQKNIEGFNKGLEIPKGIINSSSGMYRRNLATQGIQQLATRAGLPNVTVGVHAATFIDDDRKHATCMSMDLVQGYDIGTFNRSNDPRKKEYLENFSKDCNFIRGEATLQLQDVLTGQMDRHSGNVMITTGNDGKFHIIGIDNDLSFPISADKNPGVANKVPMTLTDEDRREGTLRNFCMPPVIDTDIAAPVKKGTKKHGKVHRQGKRKEARYP